MTSRRATPAHQLTGPPTAPNSTGCGATRRPTDPDQWEGQGGEVGDALECRPRGTSAAAGRPRGIPGGPRLVLTVLVAVAFAFTFAPATLTGLWVLNQIPAHPGVIFSGTAASLPRPHP
ncbi:hypothetical protein [Streptomyces sp. NPDC058307]|uniref:hypothetical protein n=1 Tax=Streptomyces sp. NPDC058307 TaxID=3346439 RepID=UPI0036EE7E3E